jgi:large subunit ribosomal protein L7/L12
MADLPATKSASPPPPPRRQSSIDPPGSPAALEAYSVILTDGGPRKIQVIKVLREVLALGLREAKDIIDQAPQIIASRLTAEDAARFKTLFEAEGATVELRSAENRNLLRR